MTWWRTYGVPPATTSSIATGTRPIGGIASTPTTVRVSDGFSKPVAGGSVFNNEVASGASPTIDGACFTETDIGSNNGWWYRVASTGHWHAATNFTQKKNEFGAPQVNGGAGGCN